MELALASAALDAALNQAGARPGDPGLVQATVNALDAIDQRRDAVSASNLD